MKSKWISDLEGFEEFKKYKVCENGDVFSYKKQNSRKLKGCIDSKGYPYIDLRCENGKRKCPKVHRLVATSFIDNPDNKPQINHMDCDKTNNHINNLEWVTNGENQKHAFKHGLNKPHKGSANYQWSGEHKKCKTVEQIDLEGNLVAVHKSLAIAGRSINKNYSKISGVCNGKGKTAYGFVWKFVK